jgi:hypothetical protein
MYDAVWKSDLHYKLKFETNLVVCIYVNNYASSAAYFLFTLYLLVSVYSMCL